MSAFALAALASVLAAQPKPDKSLTVKLTYNGSGTVDKSHKIIVFVFDSPDFVQGANVLPIASGSATEKTQTVAISGLSPDTVYLVAIFDPSGAYDGTSGPPPSGASIGLHGDAGAPAPIKLQADKPAQIDLAFDDSIKMP
jgi:uncharacterized protein (DUF2141 family)